MPADCRFLWAILRDVEKASAWGKIMLKSINTKLKSTAGATLMMALLFFIMCAVVGSIILAAAASSMGRIEGLKEADQQQYNMYSASNLIANKLAGNKLFETSDLAEGTQENITIDGEGSLTSTSTYSYFTTADMKYYWEVPEDGDIKSADTCIAGDGGNAKTSKEIQTVQTWPQAPVFKQEVLVNPKDLKYYSKNAAQTKIVGTGSGSNTGLWGTKVTDSPYLLKGWDWDTVPANQSWQPPADTAVADPVLMQLKVDGASDADTPAVAKITIDNSFNISSQVYIPADKTVREYKATDGEYYLVNVPSNNGQVGYAQSKKQEDAGYYIVTYDTYEMKDDGTGKAVRTKVVDKCKVLETVSKVDYDKLERDSNVDIIYHTSIRMVTVTRKLNLKGFGWTDATVTTIDTKSEE